MARMRTGFAEIRARFNFSDALRSIDCEQVLAHYGATNCEERINGRDGTREIIHSCLLDRVEPHHSSGDQSPSASMNIDKATFHCYSYWSGGIFDFLKKMEQTEELDGIIGVLQQVLGDIPSADRSDVVAKIRELLRPGNAAAQSVQPAQYNERAIASWLGVRHPYAVEERGLTDRAYEQLRLGYDPEARRLVFPHYVGSRLVGWQKRAIPERAGRWTGSVDDMPKYKSNPSFPKSSSLYNVDVAKATRAPVVVVESPMSVAYATGLGLDNVVATFGSGLGDAQLDGLRELFPLILWFDADGAGWKAERKACDELARHGPVSVVRPEHKKDMADYGSLDEIMAMIGRARPAVLAMMEQRRGIR